MHVRKIKSSDSELYIAQSLDRLFWIEIVKRKAFLEERDPMSALRAIRRSLEEYFDQHEPPEPYSLDDATDDIFDMLQSGILPKNSEYVAFLEETGKKFSDCELQRLCRLTYSEGFRLADFSDTSDLHCLYDWWRYILSPSGKAELRTNEKWQFANVGMRHIVKEKVVTRPL